MILHVGDLIFYKGFVFCGDSDPASLEHFSSPKIGLIISKEKNSYLIAVESRLWWTCSDDTSVMNDWEIRLISSLKNKS
jgi:hypothetical protein|tara:strand:- start:174 stop:410 length:237 start_codon:yes stop_codon:yes gene_type:complete